MHISGRLILHLIITRTTNVPIPKNIFFKYFFVLITQNEAQRLTTGFPMQPLIYSGNAFSEFLKKNSDLMTLDKSPLNCQTWISFTKGCLTASIFGAVMGTSFSISTDRICQYKQILNKVKDLQGMAKCRASVPRTIWSVNYRTARSISSPILAMMTTSFPFTGQTQNCWSIYLPQKAKNTASANIWDDIFGYISSRHGMIVTGWYHAVGSCTGFGLVETVVCY
jgi:hypothetical protein